MQTCFAFWGLLSGFAAVCLTQNWKLDTNSPLQSWRCVGMIWCKLCHKGHHPLCVSFFSSSLPFPLPLHLPSFCHSDSLRCSSQAVVNGNKSYFGYTHRPCITKMFFFYGNRHSPHLCLISFDKASRSMASLQERPSAPRCRDLS